MNSYEKINTMTLRASLEGKTLSVYQRLSCEKQGWIYGPSLFEGGRPEHFLQTHQKFHQMSIKLGDRIGYD